MEEIEITISAAGKVSAKTKGVKGARCMEYADLLAQILGREESREKTAEFYEREEVLLRQVDARVKR